MSGFRTHFRPFAETAMTSETTLKCNNPPFVINTVPAHSITDDPIQCHDGRHDSVDLFDGFFFVRLDVPGRILAHDHVAGHPFEDGIAAMDDVPFRCLDESLLLPDVVEDMIPASPYSGAFRYG